MSKVALLACLVCTCLLSSCIVAFLELTDFKYWKFKETIPFSKMNTSVKIRFNGYYFLEVVGEESHGAIALYEDGYVLVGWESLMREFYEISLEEREDYFSGLWKGNWGKYRIEGDSIVIQYIAIDFPRGAWKFYQRATYEYHGRFVNDTTIHINYQRYHIANTDEIVAEYEERTYRFKVYPHLPPSENWLMYEEEATVPTKRK